LTAIKGPTYYTACCGRAWGMARPRRAGAGRL